MDAQIAFRQEDFSDSESTTVGRIALGYNLNDFVKLRGSFSTAFRTPNILQMNQPYVTRTGTREDAVQKYSCIKIMEMLFQNLHLQVWWLHKVKYSSLQTW